MKTNKNILLVAAASGSMLLAMASTTESVNELEKKLAKAAMQGNLIAVDELLAQKVNPNATVGPAKMTPLMFAACCGQLPIINKLLPLSNIDATDLDGRTALLCAVMQRADAIAAKLYAAGADKTKVFSQNNCTAIDFAKDGFMTASWVIAELLESSFQEFCKNPTLFLEKSHSQEELNKLLFYTAVAGQSPEVAALLMQYGATVEKSRLLEAAKASQNNELIKFLLTETDNSETCSPHKKA